MSTLESDERIKAEMRHLRALQLLNLRDLSEMSLYRYEMHVIGPENSPYAGLKFLIRINFPTDYPETPPLITMATNIFHPNIVSETADRKGEVGLNMLGDGWSDRFTISDVFRRIGNLLMSPDMTEESVVNEEAAVLFRKDRKKYEEVARKKAQPYSGYFTN